MDQMITDSEIPLEELIRAALEARKNAYAPYSAYWVGAAVLTAESRIYTGCNIENASYTPSICAERTAISKAVSEGMRKLKAIAVAGGPMQEDMEMSQYAYPCGVCRQVMREFADPGEFKIIVAKSIKEYQIYSLQELLPESFGPENLER